MTIAVGGEELDTPTRRSSYRSLAVLMLVAACSLMDKTITAYLMEPIKKEFALSDTRLGLISGAAFAIFFAVAGLPMGYVADRVNRRNLIAICLTAWSALTALAGLTQSFWQLLAVRMGIGVGEAGGGPGAMSIIADLFPPAGRATAVGIYSLSVPTGSIAAYLIASNVLPTHGWRGTFLAAGLPALIFVPLLLLGIREPARPPAASTDRAPPFMTVLRYVAARRSLRHLLAAITLTTFTMNGIGIWAMSYFIRIHHVDFGQVGPALGVAYPIPALIGTFAGGVVADRLAKHDLRWRSRVAAIGALACVPVTVGLVLAPDWPTTLVLWSAYGLTAPIWSGPGYALAIGLVEPGMRATQTALVFLLTNAIGFGLSPLVVGALSDGLAQRFGDQSLRYAMLAIGLVNLWASLHFFLSGRDAKRELEDVSRFDPVPSHA